LEAFISSPPLRIYLAYFNAFLRKCEIISHTPSILSNNFFQQFKRLGGTKREDRRNSYRLENEREMSSHTKSKTADNEMSFDKREIGVPIECPKDCM